VRAASNPAGNERWDYIIVGGGTAGCVLANKLSADGTKKVLMLEAGPSGDALEIAVPAGLTRLFRHPVLDWGLMTKTQPQLAAREIYLARGKTLGGSSCTNATLYFRGSAADYDSWGLEGWKSNDVLDWFVKAEDFPEGNKPFHGVGGTMHVEKPRYDNQLHGEFFKAAASLGLKSNDDFNAWDRPQEGYGEFQVTQKQGERADMYRMYLKPAMARGNLKVLTGTRTTKVAFEKSGASQRAKGVEFAPNGQFGERFAAELAAGGEVLLTAGAVHSPHLLQLSGVGDARALSELGIASAVDLPTVGANLQDHPACVYAARMKEEFDDITVTSQIYDKKNNIKVGAVLQYLLGRKGPLSTTGCDHGAFVSTTGRGQPDLQMRFVPGFALDPDGVSSYVKFGEMKKQGLSWPGGITIQLLAIRAKSKGSVGIKSTDPFIAPAININYFSDKEGADLATLREGLRLSRKIARADPLGRYVTDEAYPGPARQDDAGLDEYIRKTAHSGNALVGTCRMATSAAEGVVSSSDLRVFGVENLRVADSSVIPLIPGGQTGAPTVMIAERAAAMLTSGKGASKGSSQRVPVGAA